MAVTLTAQALAAEIGINLDVHPDQLPRAERLLAAATAKVEAYASNAPETLQNEATIRLAGYLGGSDYGGVQSESIGPRSVTYTTPSVNAAMFRNSGAAALLTQHRKRRAGAI